MKKTIKHMVLIAAGTVFLVLAGIYIEDAVFNRTFSSLDKNNIRFINSMWRQAEQGETCPLEELVPENGIAPSPFRPIAPGRKKQKP